MNKEERKTGPICDACGRRMTAAYGPGKPIWWCVNGHPPVWAPRKRSPLETEKTRSVIRGLMLADNLGDVHEEIARLRGTVGLPPLEGNFVQGWTDADWEGVE